MKLKIELGTNEGSIWPELENTEFEEGELTHVASVPGLMASGKTGVVLRSRTTDGKELSVTSLKMFQLASAAFVGEFGDETDGGMIVTSDGLKLKKTRAN